MQKDSQAFTVDEVLAGMASRFHPEACQDLRAIYLWRLTGPEPREFAIHVERGSFRIQTPPYEDPDLAGRADVVFDASTSTYLRLVNGQLRGIVAIMTRKLRVRGSMQLAAKMDQIFT